MAGDCPNHGGNDQRSTRGACDARPRLRRGRRRRRPRLGPRGQRVRPRPRRARARRAPCPGRTDVRGDGAPRPGARHWPRWPGGRAGPHHRRRGGSDRGPGGSPAGDPRDPRRHRHGPLPRHRRHGPRVGRRDRSRARPEEVAVTAGTASFHLPPDLEAAVSAELDAWRAGDKVRRLWARDATLWTGTDEASWLGWLGVARDQLARVDALRELAAEGRAAGFTPALGLGMGGSSLRPEVLKMTFDRIAGYPELFVLDSTDPGQIRAIERKIDVARTLFIVSSKSGSTLEPNIFMRYFFDRAKQLVGADRAGSRFITITDPGSRMQEAATADGFRRILFGVPSIGGGASAPSGLRTAPGGSTGVPAPRIPRPPHPPAR